MSSEFSQAPSGFEEFDAWLASHGLGPSDWSGAAFGGPEFAAAESDGRSASAFGSPTPPVPPAAPLVGVFGDGLAAPVPASPNAAPLGAPVPNAPPAFSAVVPITSAPAPVVSVGPAPAAAFDGTPPPATPAPFIGYSNSSGSFWSLTPGPYAEFSGALPAVAPASPHASLLDGAPPTSIDGFDTII